nr:hypothetical protein Iba_scaffold13492CG0290 [Ipomoea batatas]
MLLLRTPDWEGKTVAFTGEAPTATIDREITVRRERRGKCRWAPPLHSSARLRDSRSVAHDEGLPPRRSASLPQPPVSSTIVAAWRTVKEEGKRQKQGKSPVVVSVTTEGKGMRWRGERYRSASPIAAGVRLLVAVDEPDTTTISEVVTVLAACRRRQGRGR